MPNLTLARSPHARPRTKDEPEQQRSPAQRAKSKPAPSRRVVTPLFAGDFVGREAALEALCERARGRGVTTIVGPAGMGKTRLAREVGAHLSREGVPFAFCDLSEARDADAVCAVVAAALDVALSASGTLDERVDRLGEAIDGRGRLLVILDNFEQLVASAWSLVPSWSRVATRCTFLVTSRQRLMIRDELVYELDPLTLPESSDAPLERIVAAEAIQLLLRRARASGAPLTLDDPATARAAARIAMRLDGIPLAIELSAARLRHTGLDDLAAELDASLGDLTHELRDVPDRARTLRGAIQWSWDLLTLPEQEAFAQCAVFRGGFTMDAAVRVLRPPLRGATGRERERRTQEIVEALVDKSLIRRGWPEGPTKPPRYSLLAGLREFAEEQFNGSGNRPEVVRAHGEEYLRLATISLTSDPKEHRRLSTEADNLFAAATMAIEHAVRSRESGKKALLLVLALERVALLSTTSRAKAFADLVGEALAACEGDEEAGPLRARGGMARAFAFIAQGRWVEALLELHATGRLAESVEESNIEVEAAATKGIMLAQAELSADAERAFAAAEAKLPDCNSERALGTYWYARSQAAVWNGDAHAAEEGARRAVKHFCGCDAYREALARGHWAVALMNLDRLAEAQHQAEASLAALRDMRERRASGYALGTLGRILLARGDAASAKDHLDEAVAIHTESGEIWSKAFHLQLRALSLVELGRLDRAEEDLRLVAVTIGRLAGEGDEAGLSDGLGRRYFVLAQARLAAVVAMQGRIDEAELAMQNAARHKSPSAPAPHVASVGIAEIVVERARAQRDGRSPEAGGQLRRRLVELLGGELGESALEKTSYDVRNMLSWMMKTRTADDGCPTLQVGPDARWLRRDCGERVDFHRGRPARLILNALLEAHEQSPGIPLPMGALISAGWPGERIREQAAHNRVYVTLTRLRKIGLNGILVHRDDGFLLDPRADVERVCDL